jgi:hypothetical protein
MEREYVFSILPTSIRGLLGYRRVPTRTEPAPVAHEMHLGRLAIVDQGFPKVSPGLAMPYPSYPCRQDAPETALGQAIGQTACGYLLQYESSRVSKRGKKNCTKTNNGLKLIQIAQDLDTYKAPLERVL